MLDALESNFGGLGGMNLGAMGAAFGRDRDQKNLEKIEAIRQGRTASGQAGEDAKTRQVAEEFVSVFMNQVMKSMRSTVSENPAFHGDNGEKFFQEMLDTEQSKSLAKGRGYGLTDLIYQSLVRMSHPPATFPSDQASAAKEAEAAEAAGEGSGESVDNDLVVDAIE